MLEKRSTDMGTEHEKVNTAGQTKWESDLCRIEVPSPVFFFF